MPQPPFKVDTRGFRKAIEGLMKISGKTFKDTLESETGMALRGATISTKVAQIYNKRTGKGIVPRRVPEGLHHRGAPGNKLITKFEGKVYHVGQPVRAGRNKPRWVRRGSKRVFKTGAKLYAKPIPGQAWLKKKMFGTYVPKALDKAEEKIENRGITAGQFYWMATKLNIKFPTKGISAKNMNIIKSTHVRKAVFARCTPKKKFTPVEGYIIAESTGIRMSAIRGVQLKLLKATNARASLFRRSVKNDFTKDMKKYMPSRYPLLFS